jgi:uncharacterized protein YdeI (YjbR/CyaY-like superfamily)
MSAPVPADHPIVEFADPQAWEAWLEENHASASGAWLRIAKQRAPFTTVRYPEVLDIALCFGWIDIQRRPLDEHFFLQGFTRRKPRGRWSQVNCEKAERLITEGRMRPPGLAAVESARADGRWEAAYPPQSRATVPPDFQRALDRNPAAKAFFDKLTGQTRYAFLYRLHNVKQSERRAERIADYIDRLNAGRTLQ